MIIFIVLLLGYMIGKIKIKGLNLGTSGILLVSLIFGHFGYSIPKIVLDIGLVLFIGSVGFISGRTFVKKFKTKHMHI